MQSKKMSLYQSDMHSRKEKAEKKKTVKYDQLFPH